MQRVRRPRNSEKVVRIRRPKKSTFESVNSKPKPARQEPTDLQNLIELTPDDLKRHLNSIKRKADKPVTDVSDGSVEKFRKFYEKELGRELGEPNEKGWVPNVICPFHDDSTPSFAINLCQ